MPVSRPTPPPADRRDGDIPEDHPMTAGRSADGVLTATGPAGVWAWVALNVEPVPGGVSGDGSDTERRAEAALADAGWLAGQCDPTAATRLELRYLHEPGDGVRCALLGRVHAPDVGAATSAASWLRDRLGTLPAHVRAAPVESAAEVQRLLSPFSAHLAGLVEVRKQIRPGLPSRPDAGVAYYLAVPRFAAGAASWDPLWQTVATLPHPFMLTVGLEPYVPPAPFIGMLGDLAARYGRLGGPGRTEPTPLRQQTFALAGDPFAAYAARLYSDAFRHYQSAVFRTRITLASPGPLPAALVAQVAATICAPREDRETTHVTVAPAPDELDTAWHNVTTLDHARWDRHYLSHLPIPVPSGLRLLAETVDAAEAVSGWRLPPPPGTGGRRVFVSVTTQTLHVDSLDTAHVAGDSFSHIGSDAVIVNRSTTTNSFNTGRDQGGPETGAAGTPPGPDRLRILLVCANPRGTEPLRTAAEDRTLRESIRMSQDRDWIEIETLHAATIDDLRRALLRRPYDIVHFSGHGTRRGLAFQDSGERLLVPSSEALAELLARRRVPVAVLNACYSLSVGRISAIGTEYTIASSGPISDPAAIEFTRGFYDAIGAGLDVPAAFEEGRGTASLKNLAFDAILLRRGEEHVAPSVDRPPGHGRRAVRARRVVVGMALDASASMRSGIRHGGAGRTRFDGVRDALADLGRQVRDDIVRWDADSDDFRLFAYAYGSRIGGGVADLASVWKAVRAVDVDRAAGVDPRPFAPETAADRDLSSAGYGSGPAADPIDAGAVAGLVAAETERLGDTTLSAAGLARLFDRAPGEEPDPGVLDHLIFGAAPMVRTGRTIRDRFARMAGESFDERTLLVISGGEPSDGDPRAVCEELRRSGIDIMSVYLTSEDVAEPRALVASPDDSWSTGARLMWEISSTIDESSSAARYLLGQGWSIEAGARMFTPVNHPETLSEFVRAVGSRFAPDERSLLPRGR
jgi:hypothetical protein